MTYSEKLKDPRWQRKRLEIYQRDNFTCLSCLRNDKTLTVHHVVYSKKTEPWDYPDHCLQTLCLECHHLRQELMDKISDAVKLSIKNIPSERMEVIAGRVMEKAMEDM